MIDLQPLLNILVPHYLKTKHKGFGMGETGEKQANGRLMPPKETRFKKGYDPRRNLKGVPKDAIEARKIIRKIGAELLTIKEKGASGEVIEYEITRYEAMVRLMFSSRNSAEKIALLKALSPGLLKDEVKVISDGESDKKTDSFIPADIIVPLIAPDLLGVYRDIISGNNTEYAMEGGRGSTKSSFVALIIIYLLLKNPTMHFVALRMVYNTIKDSSFARLEWAINALGLQDSFKMSTSPFEITYIPTKQKIYFRGADDANKLKSITPAFGYIGGLWFEEFDQFRGEA